MTRRRRFAPSTVWMMRVSSIASSGASRSLASLASTGNHVVRAADLDAVAGIEYHRDVGVARQILEPADVALEIEIADVLEKGDFVARLLEHLGDGVGVPRRIGQFAGILVGGISDDERHPLVGQRHSAGDDEQQPASQQHRGNGPKALHNQSLQPADGLTTASSVIASDAV